MHSTPSHTLINFRASKALLESFDHVCFLSGKTRTQVLSEMMRQRVLTAAAKLPLKAAKLEESQNRIRNAIEAQTTADPVEDRRAWSEAVYRRLKPFSSFDKPGV